MTLSGSLTRLVRAVFWAEFLTQGGELWQTAHRISLPSRRMSVAKAELGTKRFCLNCGAKFYDLKKKPPVCPKCETEVEPEQPILPSRQR